MIENPGTFTEKGLRALAHLPYPLLQAVGAGLGWLIGRIPNRHLRVAQRNIELCFPDLTSAEQRRLARQSLVESGRTMTESIFIWLGNPIRVRRMARAISGWDLVEEAMQAGRGVIVVSPHIGSWEYMGLYLAARFPMTSMYRPPRQTGLDQIIRNARQRTGASLVPTDSRGVRAMLQALRKGEMIGILPDQDPRDSGGTFAPFFGVSANTMTLVPKLASKTGAATIFAFAERLPRGQGFHLHFAAAPEGIADPDLVRSATALNRGVESLVKLAPAQYQWSYKRFRTRPEGERRLYD